MTDEDYAALVSELGTICDCANFKSRECPSCRAAQAIEVLVKERDAFVRALDSQQRRASRVRNAAAEKAEALHAAALECIDDLMDAEADTLEGCVLDKLATAVEVYEKEC